MNCDIKPLDHCLSSQSNSQQQATTCCCCGGLQCSINDNLDVELAYDSIYGRFSILCVAVSTYAHSHVDKRPAKITHKMRDNGNNKLRDETELHGRIGHDVTKEAHWNRTEC